MTRQRSVCTFTIRKAVSVLLLVFLPISVSQSVLAQESEQEREEQESWEPIEEIVVYGDKSLIALRRQVYRAEENFFDIFNELNDDDQFDVQCFYNAPTGTRIRRHTCRANFVVEATAAEIYYWRTAGPNSPVVPASARIAQKRKEMGEKMLALLTERPELVAALKEVTTAKDVFNAERKKRCEGRIIACEN